MTITDSLNRREVLYTEGEGGLKRVVKKEHADGSITRSEYDEAGRLKAQTDAAGRRTEYSLHMASGAVTAVTGPDGRTVRYGYNSQRQVTSVTYPDGFAAAGSMMRREGWRRRPHAAVRRRVTAMMTRRVSCRQG